MRNKAEINNDLNKAESLCGDILSTVNLREGNTRDELVQMEAAMIFALAEIHTAIVKEGNWRPYQYEQLLDLDRKTLDETVTRNIAFSILSDEKIISKLEEKLKKY